MQNAINSVLDCAEKLRVSYQAKKIDKINSFVIRKPLR